MQGKVQRQIITFDIVPEPAKSSVAVLVSPPPVHHMHRLFSDLDTTGGTKSLEQSVGSCYVYFVFEVTYLLDVTVDGELTSSQGTNHEKTSTDTTE